MSLLPTLLALPLVLSGFTGPLTALPQFSGGPNKVALGAEESLIFLGLQGDYSGELELQVRDRLSEEFGLQVVGSPVASLTDKDKRVWAIRTTEDFKSIRKKLLRPLKKRGYSLEELRATAFSPIDRVSGSAIKAAMREVERADKYVWASYMDFREGTIWVFHEDRLKSEKLLDRIRNTRLKVAFYHHEIQLEPDSPDLRLDGLAESAKEKLDALAVTGRDNALVIDLYLRDVDSFLALDRGRHTVACPDLSPLLGRGRKAAGWAVVLENRGYPFVDG
ncbi:MAG: hypothetical protein D6702_12865 [Planctomycetota bacterium]|nr:MAG: hypothetical protein D6702_12865 [Planctomycetota bacterium]